MLQFSILNYLNQAVGSFRFSGIVIMYQVIIVLHVLFGLGIIALVLIQQGKGADSGVAFGTGTSGSLFGAQGAGSFLSRSTAILACLFFTTSLGLATMNSKPTIEKDLIILPSKVNQDIPNVENSSPVSNGIQETKTIKSTAK